MTGKENWVQKMINDQKDKLCNNPEFSNRTNQFQTQVMIERGNPLLEPIERGSALLEHTQKNVPEGSQTCACHESISFNVGDKTLRERTGRPVVNHDESSHEQTMLNEVNMDFRIPGLPHSVVKHAC